MWERIKGMRHIALGHQCMAISDIPYVAKGLPRRFPACHVFLVQKLLLAVGPQNLRGSADNKLEQFLPPIYPELKARVTGIPARLAHASRRGKLMVASLSVLE